MIVVVAATIWVLLEHAGWLGEGQQRDFYWARSGCEWVSVILGHMASKPDVFTFLKTLDCLRSF